MIRFDKGTLYSHLHAHVNALTCTCKRTYMHMYTDVTHQPTNPLSHD